MSLINHPKPDASTPAKNIVPLDMADFIEMPGKNIVHRGVRFSRSSLHRLAKDGQIKTAAIRFSGTCQRRRVILRESLDAFLNRQIAAAK